ncbi:N-acetyltransferase [Porites harrisoni]
MAKAKEEDSVVMFDRDILKDIDFSKGECRLHKRGLSIDNPGDNLLLRPLCSDDYEKGFPAIQNNLTKVGDVTKELFLRRVEDIVVDDSCRGRGLGKLVVETLLLLSEKLGCYKTSLECKDPLLPFYSQFGFKKENQQNYLCKRFFH